MDLDAVLARYLSNAQVAKWLLSPEPLRQVSCDALRRSFIYSVGFGKNAYTQGTAHLDVEDMLIVCGTPQQFVLGSIWGLGQPHVFSLTPLMRNAVPVSRRFAIDLTQTTCLEFLEVVRFADAKSVVFLRHFVHTADYTLPVVAAAHLYGPAEPARPFGRLLMRASIRETANCPNCRRAAESCACLFDLRRARARCAPLTLSTHNWTQYAASFIHKARLGMASFILHEALPHGDVERFKSYVPARTFLQFGDSPYMRRMQRRAIHELGVSVVMPRVDQRVQSIALANDWTRAHEAYLMRKRPRDTDSHGRQARGAARGQDGAASTRGAENAYDVPSETVGALPEFFADSQTHRLPHSPQIFIPSPLLGPEEEKALMRALAIAPVSRHRVSTAAFEAPSVHTDTKHLIHNHKRHHIHNSSSSHDTNISFDDVTAIAEVVDNSPPPPPAECARVSATEFHNTAATATLATSTVTRVPRVEASTDTQPVLPPAAAAPTRIATRPNADTSIAHTLPPTAARRNIALHTAASVAVRDSGAMFASSTPQNVSTGWGFSESSMHSPNFDLPLAKRSKPCIADLDESRIHGCTKCEARFKMRADLQRHLRTVHQRKKSYTCTQCGKTFGHSGHLNRHTESVHLQRRRHKCSLCGDQFFQASHLQSHVAHVHDRRRPFECRFCCLRLATENGLRNHLRNLHNAQNSHICAVPACGEGFLLESDLCRHMRRVHKLTKPFVDAKRSDKRPATQCTS